MCFAQNFQVSLLSSSSAPNIWPTFPPFLLISLYWPNIPCLDWQLAPAEVYFHFPSFLARPSNYSLVQGWPRLLLFVRFPFRCCFPNWKRHMKLARKLRPGPRRCGWVHWRRPGSFGLGLESLSLGPPSPNFKAGVDYQANLNAIHKASLNHVWCECVVSKHKCL